jgi:hypothetical protein
MTPLPSGLPETIQGDEQIARFLTQSDQFSKEKMCVFPNAFLPGKRDRETSVSRHGREPIETLQSLGLKAAGERKLYGAAIITGQDVRNASLQVTPDEPPERHAVIRGWPWLENDPQEQKAQQKERALKLAGAAGAPVFF